MIQQDVIEVTREYAESFAEAAKGIVHLQSAFEWVMSANSEFFFTFRIIIGVLCAMFIVMNILNRIFNPQENEKGEVINPISLKEIILNVAAVMAIFFYNSLFQFVEWGIIMISNSVQNVGLQNAESIQMDLMFCFFGNVARDFAADMSQSAADWSIFGISLKGAGTAAAAFIRPNKFAYAFAALGMLLGFFNYLLVYMVYMDRALIMIVLNTLAPVVFALAVLKTYKKLVGKFFMVLLTTFLIFPFVILGFQVIDFMYWQLCTAYGLTKTLLHTNQEEISALQQIANEGAAITAHSISVVFNYDPFIKTPLVAASIFLKLKYSQLISSTIWKILQ